MPHFWFKNNLSVGWEVCDHPAKWVFHSTSFSLVYKANTQAAVTLPEVPVDEDEDKLPVDWKNPEFTDAVNALSITESTRNSTHHPLGSKTNSSSSVSCSLRGPTSMPGVRSKTLAANFFASVPPNPPQTKLPLEKTKTSPSLPSSLSPHLGIHQGS